MTVGLSTLGRITVEVAEGSLNETESGVVAAAELIPSLYEIVEVEEIRPADEQACDFSGDIECDPPLRGSVRIDVPGTQGICTAGFNVRSTIDNKRYVLTAGHCNTYPGRVWRTRFEDGSTHDVGRFWKSRNDSATDVGIITVNNPAGWSFGWPLVTVDPTGGQAANEYYVIDDVLNPGLGYRVCFTGDNSARTDCGYVDNIFGTAGDTQGLFHVNGLCPRSGDSGAPYFSYNVAYGVHSAGLFSGCEGGWAEQAPEAEAKMNVYILAA